MEFVRALTPQEVSSLVKERFPSLVALNSRYVPEVDLANGFPCKPDYLDVVRTAWLLDGSSDRPPYVTVVRALGTALGLILHDLLDMEWYIVEDSDGEFVSMVRPDTKGGRISVPPFSYVEKREHVQNAEVFVDLFALLATKLAPQSV